VTGASKSDDIDVDLDALNRKYAEERDKR